MQFPFLRQINRESHPNPVIRQLNPTRGNGINAGIHGLPAVRLPNPRHMAGGGMVSHFKYGGQVGSDQWSLGDLGDYNPGYPNVMQSGIGASLPLDVRATPGQVDSTMPNAPDISSPAPTSDPINSMLHPGSDSSFSLPSAGQAPAQTGFWGWMNTKHGGVKGSDWVKAGIKAMTGVLVGEAAKKSYQAGQKMANSNAPKTAPTFGVGVPVSFGLSAGGPITPNMHMKSPDEPMLRMSGGGRVPQCMATGGMVSPNEPMVRMADGGMAPGMPMQPPPAMQQSTQGAPQGDPSSQASPRSQQLIAAAIEALMGQSQNPKVALEAFVKAFGPQALQALQQKVQEMSQQQGGGQPQSPDSGIGAAPQSQATPPGMAAGGMLSGPGDGQSDSIMPTNNANVRVADGEYVLPADVVSSIGNGSSKAGANKLDGAMAQLRQHKYGRMKQPPRMPDTHNPILKTLK